MTSVTKEEDIGVVSRDSVRGLCVGEQERSEEETAARAAAAGKSRSHFSPLSLCVPRLLPPPFVEAWSQHVSFSLNLFVETVSSAFLQRRSSPI